LQFIFQLKSSPTGSKPRNQTRSTTNYTTKKSRTF